MSMNLILTQRETRGFIVEYAGRVLPSPNFVASVDLPFFVVGM